MGARAVRTSSNIHYVFGNAGFTRGAGGRARPMFVLGDSCTTDDDYALELRVLGIGMSNPRADGYPLWLARARDDSTAAASLFSRVSRVYDVYVCTGDERRVDGKGEFSGGLRSKRAIVLAMRIFLAG